MLKRLNTVRTLIFGRKEVMTGLAVSAKLICGYDCVSWNKGRLYRLRQFVEYGTVMRMRSSRQFARAAPSSGPSDLRKSVIPELPCDAAKCAGRISYPPAFMNIAAVRLGTGTPVRHESSALLSASKSEGDTLR